MTQCVIARTGEAETWLCLRGVMEDRCRVSGQERRRRMGWGDCDEAWRIDLRFARNGVAYQHSRS